MNPFVAVAPLPDRLSLDFAERAVLTGWTDTALTAFAAERGFSLEAQRGRWPRGARTAAHEFNRDADARMVERFALAPPANMQSLILIRFAQNEEHRATVARLARRDLIHPFDTLARTTETAGLMWRCHGRPRWRSAPGLWLDHWLLVLAYCVCVLVWIGDRSPLQRRTRRAVRWALAAIGLR